MEEQLEHWMVSCIGCKQSWVLEYPDGLNGKKSYLVAGQIKCKCNDKTNLVQKVK